MLISVYIKNLKGAFHDVTWSDKRLQKEYKENHSLTDIQRSFKPCIQCNLISDMFKAPGRIGILDYPICSQ